LIYENNGTLFNVSILPLAFFIIDFVVNVCSESLFFKKEELS
jgi:hypothetical protein